MERMTAVVLDLAGLARSVFDGLRQIERALGEAIDGLVLDAGVADRLAALDETGIHLALAVDAARRVLEQSPEAPDSAAGAIEEAWRDARDTFDAQGAGPDVDAAFDRLYARLEALFEPAPRTVRYEEADDEPDFKSLGVDDDLFGAPGHGGGHGDEEFAGSAPPGWSHAEPGPPRMAVESRPGALIQHIFLGTDRAPDQSAPGGFGKGRGAALVLAEAKVSVPTARNPGELPRPGKFLVWQEREDPKRHIMLDGPPEVLNEAAFLARLKAGATDEAGFLFVHGYNTPFANGLYRTAQLAVDLEIKGPVFHYSWPSAGNPALYDYDDASAVRARGFLKKFLELIVDKAGVSRLNIIAHSKGNDLMLQTLQLVAAGRSSLTDGELVMASPDVDATVAEQIIPALVGLFHGMTLYANDHDRPLRISRLKAGGVPRAGGLLPDGAPLIVQGADSIDAGDSDFAWFGLNHDAYVMAPALRYDIKALFERHTRPVHHRTPTFLLRATPRSPYWRPAES